MYVAEEPCKELKAVTKNLLCNTLDGEEGEAGRRRKNVVSKSWQRLGAISGSILSHTALVTSAAQKSPSSQ